MLLLLQAAVGLLLLVGLLYCWFHSDCTKAATQRPKGDSQYWGLGDICSAREEESISSAQ
jgi:hypothetical protein